MPLYHLLTGSNLGNSSALLAAAKQQINDSIGEIIDASQVYSSEPWGNPDQPVFYNQAIAVETDLPPMEVLERVLLIEQELGRSRIGQEKWQARTIDIDILLCEDSVINTEKLIIPHPHLHERNFALVPLIEIAGEAVHPIFEKTIDELYEKCRDENDVFLPDDEEE